jgi:hypothetical protein
MQAVRRNGSSAKADGVDEEGRREVLASLVGGGGGNFLSGRSSLDEGGQTPCGLRSFRLLAESFGRVLVSLTLALFDGLGFPERTVLATDLYWEPLRESRELPKFE